MHPPLTLLVAPAASSNATYPVAPTSSAGPSTSALGPTGNLGNIEDNQSTSNTKTRKPATKDTAAKKATAKATATKKAAAEPSDSEVAGE